MSENSSRKSLTIEQRQALRRKERQRQKLRQKRIKTVILIGFIVLIIFIVIVAIKSCTGGSVSASTAGAQNAPSSSVTQSVASEKPAVSSSAATSAVSSSSETNSMSYTTPTDANGNVYDDGTDGVMENSIYLWNNKAFELFGGSDDSAANYAQAISRYKEALGSGITVYNMVVPNHTAFGLPLRLSSGISNDQQKNISEIYSGYTSDVKAADIYGTLNSHKSEYIYFNTDHHWTGLGAYYAYKQFAAVAGFTPVNISSLESHTISPFVGSFYSLTQDTALNQNPDSVEYYDIPVKAKVTITAEDGSVLKEDSLLNSGMESGSDTYCVFSWGDQPLISAVRETKATNRKIAIIKDSYGNAFAPFLLNNYDEVHIIDFRTFGQNLKSYLEENGITEVLFLNNIMSANTSFQVDKMDALFN